MPNNTIIICDKCTTKLSFPNNIGIIHVTCPTCKTQWDWIPPTLDRIVPSQAKESPASTPKYKISTTTRPIHINRRVVVWVAIIGTVIFYSLYRTFTYVDPKPLPTPALPPSRWVWDVPPMQLLPANGAMTVFYDTPAVAPFVISVPMGGGHAFVKLEDWNTKLPVVTFFVYEGGSAEIKVPLGSYRLKFATGKIWYGEQHLFGPHTAYGLATDMLDFTEDAQGYNGHTIQLQPQAGGNLKTTNISAEDF